MRGCDLQLAALLSVLWQATTDVPFAACVACSVCWIARSLACGMLCAVVPLVMYCLLDLMHACVRPQRFYLGWHSQPISNLRIGVLCFLHTSLLAFLATVPQLLAVSCSTPPGCICFA